MDAGPDGTDGAQSEKGHAGEDEEREGGLGDGEQQVGSRELEELATVQLESEQEADPSQPEREQRMELLDDLAGEEPEERAEQQAQQDELRPCGEEQARPQWRPLGIEGEAGAEQAKEYEDEYADERTHRPSPGAVRGRPARARAPALPPG